MSRRAWWFVGLNLLIPGSVQVLAGSRRLGRFGLGATLVFWTLGVLALILLIVGMPVLLAIATNVLALWVIQVVLAFYVVLWIVLTLDTLRLVRLVNLGPRSRTATGIVTIAALVMTAGTAGYAVSITNSASSVLGSVFGNGAIEDPVDGRYNILLLGGDAGPDRLGMRPDSISIASIDADTGSTTMIGIPRNMQRVPFAEGSPLWGPFPDGYDCGVECLVSYLYLYGEEHPELYPNAADEGSSPGIEAMRDAAEGILGISLQYYVLIDMQGFSDLIDALGGVEINSLCRYPIGGFEDSNGQPIEVVGWIEPGVQVMDGWTALWYARARHGTSDYDRMRRQREVQEAILRQFEPVNVLTRFQAIADAGAQVVTTDIPQGMLAYFAQLGQKAKVLPIAKVELVPPAVDEIHPDFVAIQQTVATALAPPVTATTAPDDAGSGDTSASDAPVPAATAAPVTCNN
jgi:LCP family protein required for cell wall assembly